MYLWWKFQHIFAVVTFLGSILGGFFWHASTMRTGDAKLLAHVMATIIRSDRVLAGPSAVLIIVTGVILSMKAGLSVWGTGWILWTLILFVAGALITVFRIAPLQEQMLAVAQAGASTAGFDTPAYAALTSRWRVWVVLAVLGPVIGMALMVLKPAF